MEVAKNVVPAYQYKETMKANGYALKKMITACTMDMTLSV